MNTKKIIICVALAAILVAAFVIWKKSAREALILANPSIEQLLFLKKTGGEFTLEQKQTIEEFKAKLLARARIGVTFTGNEKGIFTAVMFDEVVVFPNGGMVVNQSVLKFSAEEINLISNALKK